MGGKSKRQRQQERSDQHYGLPQDQLLMALKLPNDSVDLMHTVAERDGLCIGQPGERSPS